MVTWLLVMYVVRWWRCWLFEVRYLDFTLPHDLQLVSNTWRNIELPLPFPIVILLHNHVFPLALDEH
jgi:hypothetical protein